MEYQKLQITIEGGVANVAMDSPKNLNAMDEVLMGELIAAFNELDANDEVKAIILSSTGRAFCGGGDIGFMYQCLKNGEGIQTGSIQLAADVSKAMRQCSKPTVGAVNGAAAGGGMILALACDYVIADKNAKFIAAFVNLGLVPDTGGIFVMARAMGANKALELALTGAPVGAEEAKQLGFVAKVVAPEELAEAATKQAKRFAKGPALAYAKIKNLYYLSEWAAYEEYAKKEVADQMECAVTEEFAQRVIAFVEKK